MRPSLKFLPGKNALAYFVTKKKKKFWHIVTRWRCRTTATSWRRSSVPESRSSPTPGFRPWPGATIIKPALFVVVMVVQNKTDQAWVRLSFLLIRSLSNEWNGILKLNNYHSILFGSVWKILFVKKLMIWVEWTGCEQKSMIYLVQSC